MNYKSPEELADHLIVMWRIGRPRVVKTWFRYKEIKFDATPLTGAEYIHFDLYIKNDLGPPRYQVTYKRYGLGHTLEEARERTIQALINHFGDVFGKEDS